MYSAERDPAKFQAMKKVVACLWHSNAELAEIIFISPATEMSVCAENFHKKKPSHLLMFKFLVEEPREKNKLTEQQNVSLDLH